MANSTPVFEQLLPNLAERDRWMQTAYAETWKQLATESQLAASRSNVYLAVQAAFLAVLAAISISVARVGFLHFHGTGTRVHVGLVLLGLLWMSVSAVLLLLAHYFVRVTNAGRDYCRLRAIQLRAIEDLTLAGLGPANMEFAWREHSANSKGPYAPFAALPAAGESFDRLRSVSIAPYEHFGNFKYLYAVVDTWRMVYRIMLGVGLIALLLGLFCGTLETWFGVGLTELLAPPARVP